MKTILFFFAMLASVIASAQSGVTVTPISANYANKTVTFRVSWLNSSRTGTHNSKVWVFVDYRTVTNNAPSGNWARALISGTPTASSGTPTRETTTDKGFWLQGTSGTSGTYNGTVTVTLGNVPAKFNWCAYATDYPPNAVVNGSSYTLKGTPPFVVNGTTLGAGVKIYSGGCITSITDATGCPGLFPLPTTTSLSANPTSICNGSSAVLTASASGATSYSFDNGSSWQTTTTQTVSPTSTRNYTLKVRSSTGCTSADSKTASVTVNALPTTTSLSANPTSICNGSSAVLTAAASGAASYSFDNGSSWQPTTTKTVNPTATTNYTLKVRSSTGCISSNSKTASVTVLQKSARDAVVGSCGCASGLTAVGGYCRNLAADGAKTYTGCNVEVYEAAFGSDGYTRATGKTYCSNKGGGWKLANCTQLACMQSAGVLTICHWYAADEGTIWAVYKRAGCFTSDGICPNGLGCSNCTGDHTALAVVCVR